MLQCLHKMPERNFGPARLGRSTKEADFHQARFEAIQALLIESQVAVEDELVAPAVSYNRRHGRTLILGGSLAVVILAACTFVGDKKGDEPQPPGQEPVATRPVQETIEVTPTIIPKATPFEKKPAEPTPPEFRPVRVGEKAPDFELPTLDGQTVRLSDFAGRPVIIFVYGNKYGASEPDLAMLRDLKLKVGNSLEVLTVAFGERAGEAIKDKISPILIDQTDETSVMIEVYGVQGYPTIFFIDDSGVLLGQEAGLLDQEDLERYQEPMVAGKPVEKPTATATSELAQLVEQISDLIGRGHQDIIFTEEQTKYHNGPDQVIRSLLNCGGSDPLILPYPGLQPKDAIVPRSDPVYFASLRDECFVVGEATRQWYELTGKQEFVEANRLMRTYHKARLEEVSPQDPSLKSWHPSAVDWEYIDQELYIPLADQ